MVQKSGSHPGEAGTQAQGRRVAVVTGGAAGIGRAYVQRLAQDGHTVVIADINPAQGIEQLAQTTGVEVVSYLCDVSQEESVNQFAQVVLERFGRCDILVNNAGIYYYVPFDNMDFKEWRRTLATNLDSMFLMCKAFVPGMKDRHYGRIVNVSSGSFSITPPGFTHYVTSKGGVIGFTRALAAELGAFGIVVNAIAPGLVPTETARKMWGNTPLFEEAINQQAIKRSVTPEDLANVVSFLTSDDAAFMTGQTLAVDGGATHM